MSVTSTLLTSVVDNTTCTSVIVFLLMFLIGYYWLTTPTNLPPGPPGLPVVGNLFSLAGAGSDLLGLLKKWRHKYGDVFTVKVGNQLVVVINSYKLLRETFVKHGDIFSARPTKLYLIRRAIEAVGKGIVFSDGPQWKELRRVTLMAWRDFGVGKKSLEQRVLDEALAIVEVLDKGQGQPMLMRPFLSKFSANVICSVVLGSRFDYEDPVFHGLVKKINVALSEQQNFAIANFVPLTRVLPPVRRVVDEVVGAYVDVANFVDKMLKEHEATYDPSEVRDFVDLCMKTREESKDSRVYTATNMRQVILDLLGAGTDTTGTTLDWIILYLIAYPKVQKRCQQEIDRVVGQQRATTMDDRKNMPFIMAVITEVHRLATVVPLGVPHCAVREGEVGGYRVPRDSIVLSNIEGIHHDPNVWTEPEVFRPERFLGKDGQFCPPKENYVPFSIGPRMCLGESLARMQVFILFSTLLQSFTFTVAQGHSPDLQGHVGIVKAAKVQPVHAIRRETN